MTDAEFALSILRKIGHDDYTAYITLTLGASELLIDASHISLTAEEAEWLHRFWGFSHRNTSVVHP